MSTFRRCDLSNDDDWMWGLRRTKAASWSLGLPPPIPGREQPRFLANLL